MAVPSQTTLKRRSTELLEVRKRVSGGEDVLQLSNEVDWEKLVEELKKTTDCLAWEFNRS